MTPRIVLLGSNDFVDCDVVLGLGDQALVTFDIKDERLLVSVEVRAPPAKTALVVRDNAIEIGEALVTRENEQVTVSWREKVLLAAALVLPDTVRVDALDLRPLGLTVRAEAAALHIGASMMAGNTFVGAHVGVRIAG